MAYKNKKSAGQLSLESGFSRLGDIAKNEKVKYVLRQIPWIFCFAFAVMALAQIIYYTTGPAEGYFHSDCTDSLYWAEAAVDSGKVFTPEYYYAALLPFSAQVWIVPLIHILGVTMTTHVIVMVIFALLFFASIIFFCRSMEWSWSFSLFSSGALLLMLSSSDKMREIMWGHVIYYSLGLLILFTGMGLMLRMCRHFEKGNLRRAWVYAALFFVFMMFGATNGAQCLAIYTLPMFAAIVADAVFNSKEKLISAHNKYYWFAAALLMLATALGLYILGIWKGDIIAGYADAYSMLDSIDGWVDNLLKFPESYFSLYGINIADGTALNGEGTLEMLIKLAASVIMLVLPFVLLVCYGKIEDKPTRFVVWLHFAVSAVIMVGFICGRLSAGNWRLIPMVGTSILASVAAIRFMILRKENFLSWRRVGVLLAIFPLLCSLVNYREINKMPADYGKDNAHHQLVEFLEEKGLEYGYAEFWTAQATTVLSDSKAKVRPVTISYKDGINPYLYQVNANWFEDQEGVDEYFVVLSAYEYNTLTNNSKWITLKSNHLKAQYDCAGYMIVVFDSNIWPAE
ncbi:MAG: hypothetical protein IJW21_09840, partial [Clostridia bacterium]|nr:hypothetical protein [Clostridia bacterium]